MTTTLTQPTISGSAGEVEQFAAEQGMTGTLFGRYEAAKRIFHQASGVRLEVYEDPEDSTWISVYFVIEGWAESVEVTLKSTTSGIKSFTTFRQTRTGALATLWNEQFEI